MKTMDYEKQGVDFLMENKIQMVNMNDIEDYERWRTCECDCHPHWITQQTKCAICQHEWVAVYPEDKIPGGLECPACEHMTGSDNG